MNRASRVDCSLQSLSVFTLAVGILLLLSNLAPSATGEAPLTGGNSTNPDLKSGVTHNAPAANSGSYTLNKFIYPGATTFASLSPTLAPSLPQINSWSPGVPLLYLITIGNSNQGQTSLVNITLNDGLNPSSNNPNFVILKVSCNAFNGAVCPFATNVPPIGTTLPLAVPNIQTMLGGEVVFQIEGYYKTAGQFINAFSVSDSTTQVAGTDKSVQINNGVPMIDLALAKSSVSVSSSPPTINYTITLTGDNVYDYYPGGLQLLDRVKATYPPGLSYLLSNFNCTSTLGSTCLSSPGATPSSVSFSGGSSYASYYIGWPANAVIKKGSSITMTFQLQLSFATNCGGSNLKVENEVFFSAFSDQNPNNNGSTPPTLDNFATNFQPCVPVAGISKTRVCPTGGCPATVPWGGTATYQIVVTNNTAAAQSLRVVDNVSKGNITVPVKATLNPSGVPPDVQCSQACSTTSLSPQNLIQDLSPYTLFTTDFTLPPNGSITLTFEVKIDKLADCQMDLGNVFINTAQVYSVSSGTPVTFTYVASSGMVPADLPDLPICKMKVTKTRDFPAGGVTFGQPVSFTIVYQNLEPTASITVHTLRDLLNVNNLGNGYGTIPITGLSASCVQTGGVSPMPIHPSTGTIYLSTPGWSGITVIHEASGGITFPPASNLTCNVTFTPQPPSTTDNLCQGKGQPEIVNNAMLDVSGIAYYNNSVPPVAPFFAQASVPLPLCRRVSVVKTPTDASGNALSATGPGGLLTFQIKITNFGNDPVSNFVLSDQLPPGFTDSGPVSCQPVGACVPTPAFSGTSPRTLNAILNPIPGTNLSPTNTVTLSFLVNASAAGGTYVNTATGEFADPAGSNFYFEGDPSVLVNSAQVQVLTPMLAKSVQPASIAVNGAAAITFTITNQTSDPPQTGISFTDQLPSGVTVTSAPATACGGTVSISGGNTITFANGALAQGQHQCQFVVNVKASSCGEFVNDRTNFSQVTNLDVTGAQATLTVTDCPTTSCEVVSKEISCRTDDAGGYLYTFTVTNNSGYLGTDILLTPPANGNFTFSQQQFPLLPGGLADGASITLSVNINGGTPKQEACFYVTLLTADGECCTTRVCPVLPECCGFVRDENIECNKDGSYSYTLSVVNTGVNTLEHVYLYPPAGVTMTPNYFAVSLQPKGTFTTTVTIKGAKPGDKLCFDISLHTQDMKNCCKGQKCIFLPECPASIKR